MSALTGEGMAYTPDTGSDFSVTRSKATDQSVATDTPTAVTFVGADTITVPDDADYLVNGAALAEITKSGKVTAELVDVTHSTVLATGIEAADVKPVTYTGPLAGLFVGTTTFIGPEQTQGGEWGFATAPETAWDVDETGTLTTNPQATTWNSLAGGLHLISTTFWQQFIAVFGFGEWSYQWNHGINGGLIYLTPAFAALFPQMRLYGDVINAGITGGEPPIGTPWELVLVEFGLFPPGSGAPDFTPEALALDLPGFTQTTIASGSGPAGTEAFDVTIDTPSIGWIGLYLRADPPAFVPGMTDFDEGADLVEDLCPWQPDYFYPGASYTGGPPEEFVSQAIQTAGSTLTVDGAIDYLADEGSALPTTAKVRPRAQKRVHLDAATVVGVRLTQDTGAAAVVKGRVGTLLHVQRLAAEA